MFVIKKAFSLAEVLVTLAVIGIIAIATIPTLLQNMEDAQHKTAVKAAYSKLSQAIMYLVVEEGSLDVYFANNYSLKPKLVKYLKLQKTVGLLIVCQVRSHLKFISRYVESLQIQMVLGEKGSSLLMMVCLLIFRIPKLLE